MQKFLRHIYISQIVMALSASAFVYTCAVCVGRHLPWDVYVAAFFGTWAVYLWDSGLGLSPEDKMNQPLRHLFFRKNQWLPLVVAPASLVLAAVFLLRERITFPEIFLFAILGVIGVGYVFPITPTKNGWKRLKEIGAVKTHLISIAWLLGGIGLPLTLGARSGVYTSANLLIVVVFFYLSLYLDTLALDWRDKNGDKAKGIQTRAVQLGKNIHKVYAAFCGVMAVYAAWAFHSLSTSNYPAHFLAATGIVAAWLVILILLFPMIKKREIAFGVCVSLWRFLAVVAIVFVNFIL